MNIISSSRCAFGFPERIVASAEQFQIEAGTFNLLLGGNGAGKSTILATLARDLPLLSGNFSYAAHDGVSVSDRIGYVPQRVVIPQYLPMCVEEFITLGATRVTGFFEQFSSATLQKRDSLIEELGLSSIRSERVSTISVGQLQRATIARELLGEPRLLLLDETTSGIDVKHQTSVMRVIQAITPSCSVLLATHDLHHVSLAVDWVYSIEDEQLIKKSFEESRCC